MVNELYLAMLYRPAAGRAAGFLSGVISRLKPASPRSGGRRCPRGLPQAGAGAVRVAGAIRAGRPRLLPGLRPLVFITSRVSRPARQRRAAADAAASRAFERGACDDAGLLRRGSRGVSRGYGDPCRGDARNQGVSDTERYRHARPAAQRSVRVRAHAVVRLSFQGSGQALLTRQINRMANAGDFAVSQADELGEALDALTSNEFVMGDHHFALQVLATPDEVPEDRPPEERLQDVE